MDVKVEKQDKGLVLITVTLPAEEVDKALDKAYRKNKNRFNIPGFRRGHATRALIEKLYGEGVFYEEAARDLINSSYPTALDESGTRVASRPDISLVDIGHASPLTYTALVALRPEVTLGDYMGIEVERADESVSDEDVQKEIERVREANARIIPIEDGDYKLCPGDTAVIDFEGFVGDEAFEGGKGADYPLVLGSHSFIDNFEDQLVGKSLGDNVDVFVTFPTPYQEPSLEGKEARFRVCVKAIKQKELPELDDELASEVSEFDTLKEYRESVRKELQTKKSQAAAQENEARVLKAVTDAAGVELAEMTIEQAIDDRVEEARESLARSGLTLEQFLSYTGQTMDSFREGLREDVTERLKFTYVFEEIAQREGIGINEAIDKVVAEAVLTEPVLSEKPSKKSSSKAAKAAKKTKEKEDEAPDKEDETPEQEDEPGKDEVEF